MDNVFAIPQLSGTNFSHTRMPHVSHAVLCAGPIGGTYALPKNPSAAVATHLRRQLLAQSLMLGAAPTAVARVPPPPARGRSATRGVSRARVPPVDPPAAAPRTVGLRPELILNVFFCLVFRGMLPGHLALTRMGQLLLLSFLRVDLPAFEVSARQDLPPHLRNSKLPELHGPRPANRHLAWIWAIL